VRSLSRHSACTSSRRHTDWGRSALTRAEFSRSSRASSSEQSSGAGYSEPCSAVRKPSQRRERVVRPVTPAQVEQIRRILLARGRMRDAVFVSVLAYAGLRPSETLALTWGNVRKRTILVEQALALGRIKTTMTGQTRTVRLLAPLATDLSEWHVTAPRPVSDATLASHAERLREADRACLRTAEPQRARPRAWMRVRLARGKKPRRCDGVDTVRHEY
jgi:integrase